MARQKPIVFSYGDPELTLLREVRISEMAAAPAARIGPGQRCEAR
jgi:hypothetical protein